MKLPLKIPEENIRPLRLNGLSGRLIHIKNDHKKVIIYIHGLHTMAERHYSLCEYLADFGEVYAPDLPGFGGMSSFYSLGLTPSHDNYADYIYTFIKSLNLKPDRQVCFVGLSFGSQVLIRLLQKHKDIAEMNPQIITLAAIGSGKDIKPLLAFKSFMYPFTWIASRKLGSRIINLIFFNPIILRVLVLFIVLLGTKRKSSQGNLKMNYQLEYNLWRSSDTRTHAYTTWQIFHADLYDPKWSKIDLEIHNVTVSGDQYVDGAKMAKTMQKLFRSYDEILLPLDSHAPGIMADKYAIAELFPEATRKLLSA